MDSSHVQYCLSFVCIYFTVRRLGYSICVITTEIFSIFHSQVGDFGMARDLIDDTYYTSKGGKIPVKWTAPEALLYKKYSTASDVWSYAMVLYEIWSVGKKPFQELNNSDVITRLQSHQCLAPPPGCPRQVYALMVDCWSVTIYRAFPLLVFVILINMLINTLRHYANLLI